jgi:hypothetical protein
MHQPHRNSSRRASPSVDAALSQREGRPFCPKCQQFVRHKDAVWVARRQCRCPVCGELLERRVENGEAPDGPSANGPPADPAGPERPPRPIHRALRGMAKPPASGAAVPRLRPPTSPAAKPTLSCSLPEFLGRPRGFLCRTAFLCKV